MSFFQRRSGVGSTIVLLCRHFRFTSMGMTLDVLPDAETKEL
jgi:hypothetical protein